MNLQKKIIVHSLQLFEVHGIKPVTMDDIAQEMGMSKKTLYVHFSGKKKLVNKAIKILFNTHFLSIQEILEGNSSPVKKIQEIYEYAINYLLKVAPIFLWDLKKYHVDSYKNYDLYRKKIVFGIIKNLLEEGQRKGEIDQTIDTELFCKFHLISLDKIITSNTLSYGYSAKDIFDNTIGISLKGILKNSK